MAVPLLAPDEDGLPQGGELQQLETIEAQLEHLAAGQAVLVGVITANGVREFVLYTGASEWIEGFHRDLQAAAPTHEIQVMAKTDPKWAVYGAFVQ